MQLQRCSFSGHETFPFRYPWLKKAVDFLLEDPRGFGREDAMVALGVGKNMVWSIRHWALVAGVIGEELGVPNNRGRSLRPTVLGSKIFGPDGWDPYLEDPGTTWLIHWQLASVPDNATTWYWVFNHLAHQQFTQDELETQLWEVATAAKARVTTSSLHRDVEVFLRTYVPSRAGRLVPLEETLDCPLVDLGLIDATTEKGTYRRALGEHPTLPNEVFAHAICDYAARRESGALTISLEDLAFAPGSPGRVFSLSEEALVARLEQLDGATDGRLYFDETAGMRQVLVRERPKEFEVLERYYRQSMSSRLASGRRV